MPEISLGEPRAPGWWLALLLSLLTHQIDVALHVHVPLLHLCM